MRDMQTNLNVSTYSEIYSP